MFPVFEGIKCFMFWKRGWMHLKNYLHEVPQSLFSRGRIKIAAAITPSFMEPQQTRDINLVKFSQLTEKTKLNTSMAPE